MSERIDCDAFDDDVAELALELLDATDRDRLMAHAAECDRCTAELASLTAAADRLVLVAAAGEPPVGFEQRAIDSMLGVSPTRRRHRVWMVAAAAALVLVTGGAGLLIGSARSSTDARVVALDRVGITSARSGRLLDVAGASHGSVLLTGDGTALLTMTLTDVDRGTYQCWIVGSDGVTTKVASWPIDDDGRGSWAVPLSVAIPSVASVFVTEADGDPIATAVLS